MVEENGSEDDLNWKGWYWIDKAAMQELRSQVYCEPKRGRPSSVWNSAIPRKYGL